MARKETNLEDMAKPQIPHGVIRCLKRSTQKPYGPFTSLYVVYNLITNTAVGITAAQLPSRRRCNTKGREQVAKKVKSTSS